jgi:YVTN family beta-propeller protein
VAQTVVLTNGTVEPGTFLAGTSLNSEGVAYDAANGLVYEFGGGQDLMILDPATNEVVGSVDIGGGGYSVLYGAAAHELFVGASNHSNGITILNATTNAILARVTVQAFPWGMAYDNGTNQLFVSDFSTENVSVVNLSTFTVSKNITVGPLPLGIAYDSAKSELFVAEENSFPGQLTVISDTNDSIVTNISLHNPTAWPVYDATNGRVYVSNGDNLSVISDTTNHVVGNYPAGDVLVGLSYDAGTNQIFAAGDTDGAVSVFNITGNHFVANVTTGSGPYSLAYDPADHDVYVGEQIWTVGVISDATDGLVGNITVGATPFALAYDAGTNALYVSMYQYGGQVVLVYNATTYRPIASVPVGPNALSLVYDPAHGDVFVANEGGDNVSIINDTNLTDFASVLTGYNPTGLAYDPALGEVFVANSGSSTVTAINDTNDSVVATQAVASGAYLVAFDPASGRLVVSGDAVANITFLNVSTLAPEGSLALPGGAYQLADDTAQSDAFVVTYNITRHAWAAEVISDAQGTIVTAIPNVGNISEGIAYDLATDEIYISDSFGRSEGIAGYNVTVISGQTDAVEATLPTGALPAGIAVDSTTGNVYVANYGQGTLTVVAQSPVYAVTFTESHLPGGTSWAVTCNGVHQSSLTTSIVFYAANGTSSFTVSPVSGYTATPSSGSIPIDGGPASQLIDFANASSGGSGPAAKYLVEFVESGLPNGTSWAVTFNGSLETGSSASLEFNVTNGTFAFTVRAVSGYVATPASGSLPVAGHSAQQTIAFAVNSTAPPASKGGSGTSGLSPTDLYLILAIAILILIVIAALILRSRRRPPPPTAPGTPAAPPGPTP